MKLLDYLKGRDMFKISYRDLRSEHSLNALQKLTQCPHLPHKVAYNVMRMSKVLDQELRKSQEEWVKLAEKIIVQEKGENGVIRFKFEGGNPVFVEGIDPEDGKRQIKEYNDKEVIIERHKINVEDLANAKLSPAEMLALEWMITE